MKGGSDRSRERGPGGNRRGSVRHTRLARLFGTKGFVSNKGNDEENDEFRTRRRSTEVKHDQGPRDGEMREMQSRWV
jgi:hypothetical protein